MATTAHISIEEYLAYNGKPNCEYLDGVLRPKALGTPKHGRVQFRVCQQLRDLGYDAIVELTVQIGPTKFLVPDVAADRHIGDSYPSQPVMLCVEILSPTDRRSDMFRKCEDYHRAGVPYCWVVDPIEEVAWEYHRDGAVTKCSGVPIAGDIRIDLSRAF